MENNTLIYGGLGLVALIAGVFLYQSMGTGTQMVNDTMNAVNDQANQAMPTNEDQEMMEAEEMEEAESTNTIVDVAVSNPSFSTLVTAVTTAGLAETLAGEGPFTVFAPTNEAFAKLPAGTVESLLADREALTKVLTYHVVPGKVMASDVVGLSSAPTVQGQDLNIKVSDGKVMINDSNVVQTDIETSNGVIHVIDTVLLPK